MIDHCKKTHTIAGVATVLLAVSTAAVPALAQNCEVKLGAVGPLSGGASAWGLSVAEGAKFAAAVVDAEGGLPLGDKKCTVKVFEFDAKSTAAGGAAAANYLASREHPHHHGPCRLARTTGFRPVAKRSGIINFSSSYMRDVMTPEFPLAFPCAPSTNHLGPPPHQRSEGPVQVRFHHDPRSK